MGTLVGSVDHLRRPLVRIEFESDRDSIVALLDTGFSGELMMSRDGALRLGVTLRQSSDLVEVAGGRMEEVQRGVIAISWLGRLRRVEVFVSEESSSRRADDPIALLGTRLLAPNLLLIDFQADSVELEEQD